MKKIVSITILSLFYINIIAQNYTIHGIVKDNKTGETLVGANIIVEKSAKGISSNTYGFYSLSLPAGTHTIICSYMGYKIFSETINLKNNITKDILLIPEQKEINEVIVLANKTDIENTDVSKNVLQIKNIKKLPALWGESDILKSLQLMPGIQSVNEGSSNLYVRGGSYDQNLFLLDEAPVYNPTHALGFFSTFNADAIKNVSIYKGAFPTEYGGRLSSVVDISMKEGNYYKTKISGGIGLIATKLSIESPIKKGIASFIISGRYSYAGKVFNFLGEKGYKVLKIKELETINFKNKISFYDLNAKVNVKINKKNHLYLSSYTGNDHFYSYNINKNNELDWGNITSTFRWNHIFSGKLFSNYTAYYSNYNYGYSIIKDARDFEWRSNIKEVGIKGDLSYYLNPKNTMKMGANLIFHYFSPGTITPKNKNSVINTYSLDKKRSIELALYARNKAKINNWLLLNYGLRYSAFLNMGAGTVYYYTPVKKYVKDSVIYKNGEIINTYHGLEPRVSAHFKINKKNLLKIAYARTIQYLHLVSNSSVGLPTDVWLPPDDYLKPKSANQYVLSYYRTLKKGINITAETYYKNIENIVDYKDNANLFMNKHIGTQLLMGKGYSFGFEFLLEKKIGKFTGWIGYTWAKTQYKIEKINKNKYYSPRYDIRHNLSVVTNLQINKSWAFSAIFKLASGGFITVPDRVFKIQGVPFFDYSARNNYEVPIYHRLDLSISYKNAKAENRRYKGQWVFSVFNVYNRSNVYSLFIKQHMGDGDLEGYAYKMYLFGIIPTITYNFSF